MSVHSLMNQTITLYNKSSYNEYGREVVGTGSEVCARVQETTKRKLLDNGNLITINAICYVPTDTSVSTDDRVDYSGNKFKVFGKYSAVDGGGNVNHIKLELVKWRET